MRQFNVNHVDTKTIFTIAIFSLQIFYTLFFFRFSFFFFFFFVCFVLFYFARTSIHYFFFSHTVNLMKCSHVFELSICKMQNIYVVKTDFVHSILYFVFFILTFQQNRISFDTYLKKKKNSQFLFFSFAFKSQYVRGAKRSEKNNTQYNNM